MIDIYLRGADQAAVDDALFAAGLIDEEGQLADGAWLDRIGQDPVTVDGVDEEEEPLTTTHPGYHANLRLADAPTSEQTATLAPVTIVPPAQPIRVWA
jgi:hypothetical protein